MHEYDVFMWAYFKIDDLLHSEYSLNIETIAKRQPCRSDKELEFMNKMSDEEIETMYWDIERILVKRGVRRIYPDWENEIRTLLWLRNTLHKIIVEKNTTHSS